MQGIVFLIKHVFGLEKHIALKIRFRTGLPVFKHHFVGALGAKLQMAFKNQLEWLSIHSVLPLIMLRNRRFRRTIEIKFQDSEKKLQQPPFLLFPKRAEREEAAAKKPYILPAKKR
jgi:hypothetical protein